MVIQYGLDDSQPLLRGENKGLHEGVQQRLGEGKTFLRETIHRKEVIR